MLTRAKTSIEDTIFKLPIPGFGNTLILNGKISGNLLTEEFIESVVFGIDMFAKTPL